MKSVGQILEAYSRSHPDQVLLVATDEDVVMIYKGFSSSLHQSTPPDPDIPTLPPHAAIKTIDIVRAPYNPRSPQYLERQLDWLTFQQKMGLHS